MVQAFTIMLVYVWARRNPYIRMNFFGLLTFNAPYLPWVLLGFSLLLGNSVSVDLLGMAVGHCYYFIEDIFPNQPGGWKILRTPQLLKTLCDPVTEVAACRVLEDTEATVDTCRIQPTILTQRKGQEDSSGAKTRKMKT